MFPAGVNAYMRAAVLAVMLILAACGTSATPQARSSFPPSATPTSSAATPTPSPTPTTSASPTPTPTAGSPLTWAAAVRVDHQAPFEGNRINHVYCSSSGLCVAGEYANVITS